MGENLKDNGFEPYIPSVHLLNIAPGDWLNCPEGKDFFEKLKQYETDKQENLNRLQDELIRLQNACATIYYAAQEGMKCGH